MRLLPLALVGLSALALSACDELAPARQQAKADCCCKDNCPTRAPERTTAKADKTTAEATETTEVATREETVRTGGHVRKVVRHSRSGGGSSYHYRSRYRSGTEGVGYLDEDLAGGYRGGGYRRVGTSVSVEEGESYSERARYSESGSGYAYSSGGGYSTGGGYIVEGDSHGKRRHRGGGYVGVDRDGYLTWPGKTRY